VTILAIAEHLFSDIHNELSRWDSIFVSDVRQSLSQSRVFRDA